MAIYKPLPTAELYTRLLNGSAPDTEVDCSIAWLVANSVERDNWHNMNGNWYPRYTYSLDASRFILKTRLPDWHVSHMWWTPHHANVNLTRDVGEYVNATAYTPEYALAQSIVLATTFGERTVG